MQNLTRLRYLDLSSNHFIGSIPSFCLSKNLESVDLNSNHFTGVIPSSHWEGLNNLGFLVLGNNSLSGSFPESLVTLTSLEYLDLSNNRLSGQIGEGVNFSSYQLRYIDLSNNNFEGPMPGFIFKLQGLETLVLSANNFNGSVELNMFGTSKDLSHLDLSYNDFSVTLDSNSSTFSSLSALNTLKLASCKMQVIPDLKNHSQLSMIDLSDNKLSGQIPNRLWEVGNGFLRFLNLSHNRFSSFQKPYTFPFLLDVLDLHSNHLEGDIPTPPTRVYYLDYSTNNFGSSIPADLGNFLTPTFFFSISNNKLVGNIPKSLCSAKSLFVLDFSNNSLNGTIPSCLAEISKNLRVLNLGRNKLGGSIFDGFPEGCSLHTLDLNENHIQGPFPQSLENCKNLEVLDLGENMITDMFPCRLSNLSNLHVFVVRSNRFYGNISCLGSDSNWTNLQIIDMASNRFSGILPPNLFLSLQAMMFNNKSGPSPLHFRSLLVSFIYYPDSVSVVFKKEIRKLVKILGIFTSIDFSNNSFQGSIPATVGDLRMLNLLNFSHNSLTGPVPMSIGALQNLESLDLSVNKLNGSIPTQVSGLTFLSFLNLSYNHFSGSIPRGPQFQTFTEASFRGNQGLCGTPLNERCHDTTPNVPTVSPEDAHDETGIYVSAGLGFLVGFVIIVGPLVCVRRWRALYYNHVDRIIFKDSKVWG